MIVVEGLRKQFVQRRGRKRVVIDAVRDVGFVARDGAITGLLGANGAGKTTTMRMIAGLIDPDAGRIEVDGLQVRSQPMAALARLGVLSDARGLYPRLTARENVRYYARLHGLTGEAVERRIEMLAGALEMSPLLDRRTEGFSQGEKMKTALARALVHEPPNVILDEPTNGLDVEATRALRQALRRMRDELGQCVVVSTHIMQEVERLCDHVVIMAGGRTVAAGTVAELIARTGQSEFEGSFVELAFGSAGQSADVDAAGRSASGGSDARAAWSAPQPGSAR